MDAWAEKARGVLNKIPSTPLREGVSTAYTQKAPRTEGFYMFLRTHF